MTGFRGDETLTVTPAAGAPGIVSQDTITLDEIAERSPGGTPAGVSIVRAFPFAFDTPDLLTGAPLYTPTPGDILLDAWIEIDTAWDGTTPLGDVGTYPGIDPPDNGYFSALGIAALDMGVADTETGGLLKGNLTSLLSAQEALVIALGSFITGNGDNPIGLTWNAGSPAQFPLLGHRYMPAKFISADPIKVCVSQDGTNTGDDPGSTVGAAVLFLVTATPV